MNSATMVALVILAFGLVTGVILAYFAWRIGFAQWVILAAAIVFGAVVAIVLLPLSFYVWNVFYRRPPRPIRARHSLKGA